MIEARNLIKQKRYQEARAILVHIDHPTAKEWIAKIDRAAAKQSQAGLPSSQRPATSDKSFIDKLADDYFYPLVSVIVVIILVVVGAVLLTGGDDFDGVALGQAVAFEETTVSYPAGWEAQLVDGQLVMASSSNLFDIFAGDPTAIDLPDNTQAVVLDIEDGGGLDVSAADALDLIRGLLVLGAEDAGATVGEVERLTINGNEATAFEFSAEGQTLKFVAQNMRDGRIALFVGIAQNFAAFDPTFMSIVHSARF
ncbi:MAG: hypothetical protein D6737_00610 [Chloroflexi bacterium]|nr:MAG: hypothetical protein CUN54_08240 [Phototrophicales bacterium]RMF82797.1 MAG: hypothetical protein D6737_00610 [Chloroflexota bacterium]